KPVEAPQMRASCRSVAHGLAGHRARRVIALASRIRPRSHMTSPATRSDTAATDPLHILDEVFGYSAFRGQQEAIVGHVTAGGDALVLMPTGGGKSLCYQVPAIARHRRGRGVTVVVSPLIALMHDQVGALEEV